MKRGKVYLIGGGCGDTGLLTWKALEILQECEVVVYDSLVSEELLHLSAPDCEKIYVGKRFGRQAMKQSEINTLLTKKAREGKIVVRLKGGDPYVFGRGGEEFLALREAGIYCEEIPGISSAIAVPAAAGIPVTHRGLSASVTVVTGTAAEENGQGCLKMDFDTLARLDGTLVILMGMHHLTEIADGLMAAGKRPDTPCAVIMDGTTSRQRCLRSQLSELAAAALRQGFTSPAVIVIGEVASLQLTMDADDENDITEKAGIVEKADIVEKAGIANKADQATSKTGISVGMIGTPHFVKKMRTTLALLSTPVVSCISSENSGIKEHHEKLEVWEMDFMEILPNGIPLPDLEDGAWLVFTSPNGVSVFLEQMKKERRDLRELFAKRIAVIGPGTASTLAAAGLYADYMPEIFDVVHLAEGLAERIRADEQRAEKHQEILYGSSAVFLRAKQGSAMLSRIFTEKRIPFVDHPLYELGIRKEKRAAAIVKEPDYIIFGSAMGARAYFEGMEQEGLCNDKSCYICIGKMCADEVAKHTKNRVMAAEEASAEGVVECLIRSIR